MYASEDFVSLRFTNQKKMDSKGSQLDTDKQAITWNVLCHKSGNVLKTFDRTAPEAICHWPQYNKIPGGTKSEASISPMTS